METKDEAALGPRERRVIALVAIALTAAAVTGVLYLRPTPQPAAPAPAASTPVPSLSAQYSADFDFVTPSLGWALVAQPLPNEGVFWVYRTTDAARHWSRQLESVARDQIPTFRFFDARNGVVLTSGSTALRTRDGGITWQPVAMPPSAIEVTFADPAHAWALLAPGSPGGDNGLAVTSDGGITWTKAVWPAGGFTSGKGLADFQFRGAGEGWVSTSGSDAALLRTEDGGRTWEWIPVPYVPPATYTPGPGEKTSLTYFSTTVVLMPGQGELAIVTDQLLGHTSVGPFDEAFVSFDRGLTWSHTSPLPERVGYGDLVFLDMRHWLAMRFGVLYRTSDTGRSWTQVLAAGQLDGWTYLPLHAIDSSHAWSVMIAGPQGGGTALAMSSDGGASWHTVNVPVRS